ncbi:flagellar hook-associated protein 2 [Jeotgalibacillus sp. S-D1]|uniref:flagellar hook-associated protein 2 n=1 Tax=Jeotgalibacillus sp. S-D1 TaxID=2552189 RepID=UPI0014053445|nr:flagellar hook-associated protein 2 [Jeotgalibacillus sp. S-D1]
MRIGGLASGIDTDSIIKNLMAANRLPLDKLTQQKQFIEWQRDDYRDINRKLNDLSNMVFDTVMRASTYSQKNVSTSSPDLSVKSISASADLAGTINVEQLALSANMRSFAEVEADPAARLGPYQEPPQTEVITIQAITAGGVLGEVKTIEFDPAEETMHSLITKINKTDTVNMFYDSFTGKVSVTAKHTGSIEGDAEIKLTGDFFANTLKLNADSDAAAGSGSGMKGQNVKFTFNGLSTERPSNSFQLNGFEFTVNQASNQNIQFSSSPDAEKIGGSIIRFVNEYNTLIEDISSRLSQTRNRDFPPLTNEQRAELSEKEAELWDEKAKSGTLRGDMVLTIALSRMRQSLNSAVAGASGNQWLSEYGITTSADYREGGKLVVDEAKLTSAITANPAGIHDLFNKNGSAPSEKGLGVLLRETIGTARSQIIERAGRDVSGPATFAIGRNLSNLDRQITRFEDRLIMLENRYYKQFSAMETAVQRANQQSAYLLNAFSGGS